MQKDYMAMMNQQPTGQITEKDIPDEQMYQEMGMPQGNTKEDAKKRLLIILEQLGILKGLSKDGLRELNEKIDEYIEIAAKGDMQALETHPIGQLLAKASSEIAEANLKPQKQQRDFAGMMPGGGMNAG